MECSKLFEHFRLNKVFKNTMIGIYALINKTNNKYYIGQSKNISKRVYGHFYCLRNKKHKNLKLQRAYDKYGKDNFNFIILEKIEKYNKDVLTGMEDKFINEFDSIHNGYNIKKATDIYIPSEAQKFSLSERHKKNGHMPPREAIEKSSLNRRGKKYEDIYGSRIANIIKEKISKNNPNYDYTRNKTYVEIYGEEKTVMIKQKLIDNNPRYWEGKNRSKEFKEKLSKNNIKKGNIIQKDKDGTVVKIWDNRIELFEQFEKTSVKKCLAKHPRFKTYKGFIWEYEFPLG